MIFCWRDGILPILLVGFASRLRTNGNDELPTGIVCPLDQTWREKRIEAFALFSFGQRSKTASERGGDSPRSTKTHRIRFLGTQRRQADLT